VDTEWGISHSTPARELDAPYSLPTRGFRALSCCLGWFAAVALDVNIGLDVEYLGLRVGDFVPPTAIS
jgi:hypothetical protein